MYPKINFTNNVFVRVCFTGMWLWNDNQLIFNTSAEKHRFLMSAYKLITVFMEQLTKIERLKW